MIGIRRPAFQDIWSAARAGFMGLHRVLADPGDPQDMVFHVREPKSSGVSAAPGLSADKIKANADVKSRNSI